MKIDESSIRWETFAFSDQRKTTVNERRKMVQPKEFYRRRTQDFSNKYRNLTKFTNDVEHFLEEYNKTMAHRHVYRRNFQRHLKEVESNLKMLIAKFDEIGNDSMHNQLFKELFCCRALFENCDELREHYFRYHYTPRLVHPNIAELDSGLAKMEHFRYRLEEYLKYGTEYTAVLVFNLKKLLKNVSQTIEMDIPIKEADLGKPDKLVYRWRELHYKQSE